MERVRVSDSRKLRPEALTLYRAEAPSKFRPPAHPWGPSVLGEIHMVKGSGLNEPTQARSCQARGPPAWKFHPEIKTAAEQPRAGALIKHSASGTSQPPASAVAVPFPDKQRLNPTGNPPANSYDMNFLPL